MAQRFILLSGQPVNFDIKNLCHTFGHRGRKPSLPSFIITDSKVGKATATSVLGLVATGDSSIKTAAANGGITKIKYVDYEVENILGIYGKYTTVVYGD